MDGDAAFGAAPFDVVDVDPGVFRLAQRRRRRMVLLGPPLPPPLAQLHRLVRRRHAEVFGLVGRRRADFLGDDLGDLFGDPAAGGFLAAVAFAATAVAAASAGAAQLSEATERAGSLTKTADRLPSAFAETADGLTGAFADLADGSAGAVRPRRLCRSAGGAPAAPRPGAGDQAPGPADDVDDGEGDRQTDRPEDEQEEDEGEDRQRDQEEFHGCVVL